MVIFYLLSGDAGGLPVCDGPARYAYQGPTTRKQVGLMLRIARGRWGFLTYRSGLVLPHEILQGQQGGLRRQTLDARRAWAEWVYPKLRVRLSQVECVEAVAFLASRVYHADLAPWLVRDLGVRVLCPLDNLSGAEQGAWIRAQAAGAQ